MSSTSSEVPAARSGALSPHLAAMAFTLLALGILWGLLSFIPPLPAPQPGAPPPRARIVAVSYELLGVAPSDVGVQAEEDATPASLPAAALSQSAQPPADGSPEQGRVASVPRVMVDARVPTATASTSAPERLRPERQPPPTAPVSPSNSTVQASTAQPPDGPAPAASQVAETHRTDPATPAPTAVAVAPPPIQAAPTPVPIKGETRKPKPIRKVVPVYPPMAHGQRLTGPVEVVVNITVGPDGSVEKTEIVRSNNLLFNQSALAAAQKWRFEPGLINGEPIRMVHVQPFTFKAQ